MSHKASFPWWLKPANRLIILLNRLGMSIGTMRSTPVSVLHVNGQQYILGPEAGWVKNARTAGWGLLSSGRKQERVTLVELPVEERPPILREFPAQVPGGVAMFARLLDVPADPEAFAQAAPRCPVFRLERSSITEGNVRDR